MRGRKPKQESRGDELRAKLAVWRQTSQSARPSLRTLARDLGVSHQLLSSYLQHWDDWQRKEYKRKAKEIRASARNENREMTAAEESQARALEAAAFDCIIRAALQGSIKELSRDARVGKFTPERMGIVQFEAAKKLVEQCVRGSVPGAQKLWRKLTGYDSKLAYRQKIAARKRADALQQLNMWERWRDHVENKDFRLTEQDKALLLRGCERKERFYRKRVGAEALTSGESVKNGQNNLPQFPV